MEENNNDKTNKSNNNTLEIVVILGIIFIVIIIFKYNRINSFFKNTSDNYDENFSYIDDSEYDDYENNENNTDKRLECFELSVSRLETEELGVVLKNTSQSAYSDLQLNIIFYNGDRKPISVEKEYINCILPDSKWVGKLYSLPEEYETYDFLVTASNYDLSEYVKQFKSVEINQVFDKTTNMSVRFENHYNKKVNSATAAAIYYNKNGSIANVEYFYVFNLKSNKAEEVESYDYLDFKKQENSGVEIVLTDVNVY